MSLLEEFGLVELVYRKEPYNQRSVPEKTTKLIDQNWMY